MKYLEKYNLRKRICLVLVFSLLVCAMFNVSSMAETNDLHGAIAASAASGGDVPIITAAAEWIFTVDDLTLTHGGNALEGGIKFDNGYLYTAYTKTDTNASSWIRKYDLEGNVIETSNELNLGHANDFAYNGTDLVVAHGIPVKNQVSIISPDDINTIKQTYYISQNIYCIDYNASKNAYVVGLAGKHDFQILNENFTPVNNTNTVYNLPDSVLSYLETNASGYMTQGCTSDDKYIYFGISDYVKEYDDEGTLTKDATGNYIVVCDWEGNFQTLIHIPFNTYTENGTRIDYEIEYLYIENGVIYFGTNNKIAETGMGKKADLYKVIMP